MRTPRQLIPCILLILTLLSRYINPQTTSATPQTAPPYSLSVAVDEVVLTFHAADAHGLPVNDLRLDELALLDNGRPPRKMLAFQSLQDRPIRVGILIDESESMAEERLLNRAIATSYVQQVFRQQTDQAFVMDFASLSTIAQPWTTDPTALAAGLRRFADVRRHIPGTAIFDALYRACLNQFGHVNHGSSGNFILLFSDGEDNASLASLNAAVGECERTNTAIYTFRFDSKSSFGSPGPATLVDLTAKTGGRVFHDNGSPADIDNDLRIIEADLRNQYRLIYRPAELKHNGSFHRVDLQVPERIKSISIRSGYYAPTR